jgi:hypothetical protein
LRSPHTGRRLGSLAGLLLCATCASAAPFNKLLGLHPIPRPPKEEERYTQGQIRFGAFIDNERKADGAAAAARPDNGGAASNLYQLYLHDAVRGEEMGFVADLLFLSDRGAGSRFKPTQFDYLIGLPMKRGDWRLQFDREEALALHRPKAGYRTWDARLSLELGGAQAKPGQQKKTVSELRGVLTAGCFLHNHTMPARSDRTGLAMLRYNARGEAGVRVFRLRGEADFLTEKHGALSPVQMNLSMGAAVVYRDLDLAFTRESGKTLDRGGSRAYYLLSLTYPFSLE